MPSATLVPEGLTLRNLVLHGKPTLPEQARAALSRNSKVGAARKMVESGAGAGAWAAGLESLEAWTAKALDLEISDLIAWAWNTQNSVREAMQRTAQDPDRVENVPLATHTIKSTHHPYIEISLGDIPIQTITFDLTAEIDLEGAVLTIQQGAIDSVTPGSCKGNLELALEGVEVSRPVGRRRVEHLDLERVQVLGPGLLVEVEPVGSAQAPHAAPPPPDQHTPSRHARPLRARPESPAYDRMRFP